MKRKETTMLRSDEVMIGDWVSSDDGNAIIIPPIAEDGVFLKDATGFCAASFDRINPIPLTAEILEKNGFKFNELPFVLGWEQFGLTLYLAANGYCINCGQNIALNRTPTRFKTLWG